MVSKFSLAFVLAIEVPLALAVGAFVFTALDPIQQDLMQSAIWNCGTSYCSDALGWQSQAWSSIGITVMFMLLFHVFIISRRATA